MLGPEGVLRTHLPFLSLYIVGGGGQPYLLHQTPPLNCIFRGIPLTHSFLVVPTCPVPLQGRNLLAKVGASTSFALPIRLSPDSQVAPLLLILATQPTVFNMSFPLPASLSLGHPKTHLLLDTIIQLQDPTCFIIKVQYPFPLQNLRRFKPIICDFLRKNDFDLHLLLLPPLYLQLRKLTEITKWLRPLAH